MSSLSLPIGVRIGMLYNICAYLIIGFSKNSGTFEFPSLALALLLNLTVGLGLTGGAGAAPLLRVILSLTIYPTQPVSRCSERNF